MKKITLQSYSDPAHGWLKVSRKLLSDLGILEQISRFSYQRKDSVYLEEDRDAGILLKKLEELGVQVKMNHRSGNKRSKIRSYETFTFV